jgi:hypothetical protein
MASPQKPNVIILTSGISGSSVLAGLISRSRYWTGEQTYKKEYDTHENQELIDLNVQLIQLSGYKGNYAMEFPSDAIRLIDSLNGTIDAQPFREFLRKCDEHRPWVWKDPRLWLTIRFWRNFLNVEDCRFVLLTRGFVHCWVSSILRRHIRSFSSLKRYEQSIQDSLTGFLKSNGLPCLHITFENLVVHPEETIRELNGYLETELSVEDLAAVYSKPLYKAPRSSAIDYVKAMAVYIKNYSERFDLQENNS